MAGARVVMALARCNRIALLAMPSGSPRHEAIRIDSIWSGSALAEETYQMLNNMPFMGAIYHTNKSELMGIRFMPIKGFSRYLVFYKVTNGAIDIIRVLHSRMDKDGWL